MLYVWIHYIPFGNTWQFQYLKECILILMKEMLTIVSSDNWLNCWQLLHHHLSMFIARQWDFLFIIFYLNIVYPTITAFPFVNTVTLLAIVLLKKMHWTALDVNVNSPIRISEGIQKWLESQSLKIYGFKSLNTCYLKCLKMGHV